MSRKMLLVAGAAAGYVLGTRAGRHRYEQLAAAGRDITAQSTLRDALNTARDHAVRIVRDDPTPETITLPETNVASAD
jgi:hypothetical protein